MLNTIFIKLAPAIITGEISLRILVIFPFLLRLYEKLSPARYICLKNTLIINSTEAESIKRVLRKLFELLVHLNFMLVNILFIFMVCAILSLFVKGLGRLVDYYISSSNPRRERLSIRIIILYTYISIIIYDIALLSDLILNDSVPLRMINATSIFWISKFPFITVAVSMIILLIIPMHGNRE